MVASRYSSCAVAGVTIVMRGSEVGLNCEVIAKYYESNWNWEGAAAMQTFDARTLANGCTSIVIAKGCIFRPQKTDLFCTVSLPIKENLFSPSAPSKIRTV